MTFEIFFSDVLEIFNLKKIHDDVLKFYLYFLSFIYCSLIYFREISIPQLHWILVKQLKQFKKMFAVAVIKNF